MLSDHDPMMEGLGLDIGDVRNDPPVEDPESR